MNSMTDQAVALVNTVALERTLEQTILNRMVPLSKAETTELFVGMAPLSSLSAKIKIAYAMGIIGEKGKKDMDLVKDIRNQFAHSFHELSFETPEVSSACFKLTVPDHASQMGRILEPEILGKARYRFILSCQLMWVALGGKSVNSPRPKIARDRFSQAFLH